MARFLVFVIYYKLLVISSSVCQQLTRESAGPRRTRRPINLDSYNTETQIDHYLKYLEHTYQQIVQVNTTGKSYEGRAIKAIRIGPRENENEKPTILIDAGIHAREWIAPAVALCLISELVENYENNKHLVNGANWYIIPLLNPDGYVYSMKTDRMWRKNRSKTPNSRCPGVDLNRNFGFNYGGGGTSKAPCDEIFIGNGPFSEPEARALRDFAEKLPNLRMYITVHSYGKYILYPWGFTHNKPQDWADLDKLARKGGSAIRSVFGTRYRIGTSTGLLGVAAGGSDDYMKGMLNVKYSYTMELPGGGREGFDLPRTRIKNVCRETLVGIKAMGEQIVQEQYVNRRKRG